MKTIISNGKSTERRSILSIIILVIKKSDECDEGIQFVNHNIIKSMITDRIGRHDVLLPIDQKQWKYFGSKLPMTFMFS